VIGGGVIGGGVIGGGVIGGGSSAAPGRGGGGVISRRAAGDRR